MATTAASQLIYLHGFASGPGSNKAQRFARALRQRGVEAEIPDLNEGDFTGLTLSRQLALLDRITGDAAPGSVVLVGSSMGAYAATLFAASDPRPAALLLMAPAFGFVERWTGAMSADALARWEQSGAMQVFHFASETLQPIGWSLVQDARNHPPYPRVNQPTLVFHGRRDETVPVACSERFAAENPGVTLELLDSDHSLADKADWIVTRSLPFLARWFPQLEQEPDEHR